MRFNINYIGKLSKFTNRNICTKYNSTYSNLKPPWKILFFGTDNFSLASLKALNREYFRSKELIGKLEIVTSVKNSFVRKYAEQNQLKLHDWPFNKPKEVFDIGLVVSFGHLIPKNVIDYFPMGMLNVHASLLPRWRGAAPIIYALAKGDVKTGVSIMRIKPDKFDIGEVLRQEEIAISDNMKMPELHTKLAELGAHNLLETIKQLPDVVQAALPQSEQGITFAPKVTSSMAHIDFTKQTAYEIYNLCRALTGLFPLMSNFQGKLVKIHNISKYELDSNSAANGFAAYDKINKSIKISCSGGYIYVDKIGILNKKVMNASEFNNGYIKKLPLDHRIFM